MEILLFFRQACGDCSYKQKTNQSHWTGLGILFGSQHLFGFHPHDVDDAESAGK